MDIWASKGHDLTRHFYQQYQEAEDAQIPFAQGLRPQIPPQPQACASRHHAGTGTSFRVTAAADPDKGLTTSAEGGQGGQAGCRINRLTSNKGDVIGGWLE